VMMTMSVTSSSSGGVFTSGMAMEDADGTQLMNWSITGTSASDGISTHGTLGDVMAITLAMSKPDGRLDTMSQMDLTLTMESMMDGEDDDEMEQGQTREHDDEEEDTDDWDSMDLSNVTISLSLGYDGTDTWDATGIVSQSGDTIASVEAHVHEEWVSLTSWANEDVGDMIGAGSVYEYVNTSMPFSDSSDMWSINYVQTSDYIETTNVSWHSDASTGISGFSFKSFAMEMDDGGAWQYIFTANATGESTGGPVTPTPAPPAPTTMTVSGSFKARVAASDAQDFISNPVVVAAFVSSIAERVNAPESMVEVTLSVQSSRRLAAGGGRRMTAQAEILVSYVITAEVSSSGDGGAISESDFDSMVDALESTTAADFVAGFTTELQERDGGIASRYSAVAAVENSETAPATAIVQRGATAGARAAFPQALLFATACGLAL